MKEQGTPVYFPPNPAPYMVDWLLEIGPAAGEGPIGWQDMAAWEKLTGIELEPWEAKTLRQLSRAFLKQKHDARKPNCPPPYSGRREEIIANRDRVAEKVRAVFSRKARES